MKKAPRKAVQRSKPVKQAESNARKSSDPGKSSKSLPLIIGGIVIIVLIIGGAIWYYAFHAGQKAGSAATVNGKAITGQQLEFQYSLLPESYRETFSKDQVLEQIIDEELIVQAAQRKGVTVSPQDVNERVQQILAQNELTPGDLQKNLEDLNITLDDFEKLISRQIIIDRYLNSTLRLPEADEATLEGIYNATRSKYALGEQVTVRHVLVAQQRPDAALIAKQVYDSARNGTDFCSLVLNYSDDRGSRNKCGEYTFPRGFMVPEFEKASFEMKDGEIRLVQTSFGEHIIQKLNSTAASVRPFSEVRDTIKGEYETADRSKQYREIVSDLRAEATIVYANGTTILPRHPGAMIAPAEAKELEDTTADPTSASPSVPSASNVTGTNVAGTNATAGTNVTAGSANATDIVNATGAANATVQSAADADVTANVTTGADITSGADNATAQNQSPAAVNSTPNAVAPAQNATGSGSSSSSAGSAVPPGPAPEADPQPEQPALHELFACIASKSKLYGASWDAASQSARQMFTMQGADLEYIECDTQKDACSGITAYPTWTISGKTYVGQMTPSQLQQASDCK
jgi:parvulin-like peptidyl-prolyl isomerase